MKNVNFVCPKVTIEYGMSIDQISNELFMLGQTHTGADKMKGIIQHYRSALIPGLVLIIQYKLCILMSVYHIHHIECYLYTIIEF